MRRRTRGEQGSALVEFSWLAIILPIPLIWVVLSIFEVQRGAVDQVLADEGAEGQRADVSFSCRPRGNCHVGTAVVTVTVRSGVTLPFSPRILGREGATFTLDASHTVPIGQYVESARSRDDR